MVSAPSPVRYVTKRTKGRNASGEVGAREGRAEGEGGGHRDESERRLFGILTVLSVHTTFFL